MIRERRTEILEGENSEAAVQIGRYIVTMMSTGVIRTIGFQLSGGDSQLNALVWYSWLGGLIIGTMIGSNSVLEEHCRAGLHNVVISGSTGDLEKHWLVNFFSLGIELLLLGGSLESVQATVRELEENLKEGIANAGSLSRKNLAHAKVVGIECDVCEGDDVQKLANFAISELGSIDFWVSF